MAKDKNEHKKGKDQRVHIYSTSTKNPLGIRQKKLKRPGVDMQGSKKRKKKRREALKVGIKGRKGEGGV